MILNSNDRQRVVGIDDHPLFRKGLTQLLRAASGFEQVAEAAVWVVEHTRGGRG